MIESFNIMLQPETRPISQEKLVAEVKSIYAGLLMVEGKCIKVDRKLAKLSSTGRGAQPKLNSEQWQALRSYASFYILGIFDDGLAL